MSFLLSWTGNCFLIAGLWQMGDKHRSAFLLSFIGEIPWTIYAIKQHDWALAFICLVFCGMAVRNWFKWSKV